MNNAEKDFCGTPEAMAAFIRSTRRPGERPSGYDSRHDFEFAVVLAEEMGERGETLLAELMKMKKTSEVESEPGVTAQDLVAV